MAAYLRSTGISPNTSACGTLRSSVRFRSKARKPPDFVNLLITRDVHSVVPTMQARYVILCNQHGGVINDPVLLRVADDEFWFSISDSDVPSLGAGGQLPRRLQGPPSSRSTCPRFRYRGPSRRL